MDVYNDENVHAVLDTRFMQNHTQPSFGPISPHRFAEFFGNAQRISEMRQRVFGGVHAEISIFSYFSLIKHSLDFVVFFDAVLLFQVPSRPHRNKKTPKNESFQVFGR